MALTIDIFDQKGTKLQTVDLDPTVFSSEFINKDLMFQAIQRLNAARRGVIASTKTRGEVHGSGRKLYKQKGTGAARVGDKQSPLRKKGGVAFWPRSDRNFTVALSKKMKKASLRSALSFQATQENLLALDIFDTPKTSTKFASSVLTNLKMSHGLLIVVDDSIITTQSYRNISSVKVVDINYLNTMDILWAKKILFVWSAFEKLIDYAN